MDPTAGFDAQISIDEEGRASGVSVGSRLLWVAETDLAPGEQA